MNSPARPNVLVIASLFPSANRPVAGLFIRERMFRVAERMPLAVISPQPWFPFQGLIRRFRPNYRPPQPNHELQQGIDVWFPRFLSLPGVARWLDGFFMALSCLAVVRRLRRERGINLLDAHFAYPEGYAATLLGRWLNLPVTITLRGTEVPLARDPGRRKRMLHAIRDASQVFAVADSLKRHVVSLGADPDKVRVVGNGVDCHKFFPIDRAAAREQLGLPQDAKILVSVGGLVERKGFHRVIELLPDLLMRFPDLHYVVVGGACPEGDLTQVLKDLVARLGLGERVHFLGAIAPEALHKPLSASDVFVLSTANEGWANVFLEAMACGLPVVTTEVGGNAEVVCDESLGSITPFGDADALKSAIADALARDWDRERIIEYARENSWDTRVEILEQEFVVLARA
ncbi:MAG: glycosyltransferase [Gammaproteobacteria bacterium]|nr:glycosyltransferase [Gammaproteobacteria bacterium]